MRLFRDTKHGLLWGWYADENPRMRLETLPTKYRVWLEERGRRVFEPAWKIPRAALARLRTFLNGSGWDEVERTWAQHMWMRGQVKAKLLANGTLKVTAYPGTDGEYVRRIPLRSCLPEIARSCWHQGTCEFDADGTVVAISLPGARPSGPLRVLVPLTAILYEPWPQPPKNGKRRLEGVAHDKLWKVTKQLPQDYAPYGELTRDTGDCSSGCRYFVELSGSLGQDWGICANPRSHRAGLLTFEHQGCRRFRSRGPALPALRCYRQDGSLFIYPIGNPRPSATVKAPRRRGPRVRATLCP